MKITKNTSIISGALLLLAVFTLPYGYYEFLRVVIFASSLFMVYKLNNLEKPNLVFIFGLIAFMFNPIFPIYLNKGIWKFIDMLSATAFFYTANEKVIDKNYKEINYELLMVIFAFYAIVFAPIVGYLDGKPSGSNDGKYDAMEERGVDNYPGYF